MARIGVLYDKDIKERVFGVFATNDSTGGYVLTLTASPTSITKGQSSTITATLTNKGKAVQGKEVIFSVGGTTVGTGTTDAYGQATYTYQSTVAGTIQISALSSNVRTIISMTVFQPTVATWEGESVRLGYSSNKWATTNGDMVIDWGDGTTTTVNNPQQEITHEYTDGLTVHDITLMGEVTSLSNAFQYTGLKTISISNTITSLGGGCFWNNTTLTSIDIPSSVKSIGQSCFMGCSALTSIDISSVTSFGNYCFFESGLTSIVIPSGITSLPKLFQRCYSLTSVTIPSSVTSIENGCFNKCNALEYYHLYWTGDNIIPYSSSVFYSYGTLANYVIPQGQTANYVAKGYPSDKLVERS